MPQQVQGIIARSKGAPVEKVTVNVPDAGPGEAVVRVLTCGVCHTDLHYREGGIGDDYPYLLGHEAAGIVEPVGDDVARPRARRLRHPQLAGRLRHLPRLQAGPALVLLQHLQRDAEDDARGRHRAVAPRWASARSPTRRSSPPGQCTKVDPRGPPRRRRPARLRRDGRPRRGDQHRQRRPAATRSPSSAAAGWARPRSPARAWPARARSSPSTCDDRKLAKARSSARPTRSTPATPTRSSRCRP